MAKRRKKEDEILIDIAEVTHEAQTFYERNEKYILGSIGALIVIIVGGLLYVNMYQKPRAKEALAEIYHAERMFEKDSLQQALINPGGGHLGFEDIAKDYKGTPSGNMANYYAGVCYLKLGKAKAAIDALKTYKAQGEVMPILKNGLIGDAYGDLEDFSKSISYYEKAVAAGDNNFLTPYYLKKLGMLHEKNGSPNKALKIYNQIKKDYQQSVDGYTIEKYVARASQEVK